MTQEHPITPPPELVEQWLENTRSQDCIGAYPANYEQLICTQAARWGSDQELEACINYFHEYDPSWGEDSELITGLRAARRPKPPSLKELALKSLKDVGDACDSEGFCLSNDINTIRRALESLPE